MVLEKRCKVYFAKVVNKISHISDRERMMDRTLSLTLSVLSRDLGDDNKQANCQPQTARSPPAPPHLQLLPTANPPAEKQSNAVILKSKKNNTSLMTVQNYYKINKIFSLKINRKLWCNAASVLMGYL